MSQVNDAHIPDWNEVRSALTSAAQERILILDGAMGTMIQRQKLTEENFRGERFKDWHLDVKGNNDLLNITQPQIITAIHKVANIAPIFFSRSTCSPFAFKDGNLKYGFKCKCFFLRCNVVVFCNGRLGICPVSLKFYHLNGLPVRSFTDLQNISYFYNIRCFNILALQLNTPCFASVCSERPCFKHPDSP
ncbi:MAG: hypothetical protein EOP49_36090 [Sphingobacteriales bacterium]|nr:MAG: hypothetical protein EOP49_36090 [Sphingobacteriales bacterium]